MSDFTLHRGNCVEIVPTFDPQSVDAIITDLPYGTTACKWDTIIPFDVLWRIVKHVLKPRGAFVTTASQPFTSALIMSNVDWFKYEWIWDKITGRGHLVAKHRPMAQHENILVFGDGKVKYNPQMVLMDKPQKGYSSDGNIGDERTKIMGGKTTKQREVIIRTHKYPKTIITQGVDGKYVHPTQKPVALFEYLIKTYTNEGDTVLDLTMGSGTTGVACMNVGRNFIGIEKELEYYKIAEKRIRQAQNTHQPALQMAGE